MRALFVSLALPFILIANLAFAAPEAPRVLLLSSYHPGFPTFFSQVEGLKQVLNENGVELDVEFMDTKRFYTDDNFANFSKLLAYKLSKVAPYDVLVIADDNGLVFALENRDTLFKDLPMVFLGINNVDFATAKAKELGLTGVLEAVSMADSVSLIDRLLPRMGKLVILADSTPSGQGDLARIKKVMELRGDSRYEVLDLSQTSWEALPAKLRSINPDDAILLLAAYRDMDEDTKTFDESLKILTDNAPCPIFHLWEHGIGSGLVGGKVISFNEHGRLAGELSLKIINGASPASLPVISGGDANVYLFDWEVLKRFKVNNELLPEGSTLLNYSPSFFEEHKPLIFQVGGFILLLVCTICYLIPVNRAKARAEKLARESEEKYRAYIEGAPDSVMVLDSTASIILSNPAASRMTGYSPEELAGMSVFSLLPSHARMSAHADFDVLQKELRFSSGYEILRKDGAIAHVHFDAVKLTDDTYLGFSKDVTDRRQAHDALEESEARFKELLEQAGDAIFVCDKFGALQFVNDSACVSLGYTREELLKLKVWDVDPLAKERNDPETLWSQPSVTFESIHKRKDGSTFPIEMKMGRITVAGEVSILGLARDISGRKEAEDHLIQAKETAEAASRSKSEFLANVSHELRTPLNAIFGMLQMVTTTELSEEQLECINTALSSGRNLLQVINDVLDLSKIEAGKIELLEADFNLRDLVGSVEDIFSLQAEEKGLAIKWTVGEDLEDWYIGDQGRIRQVLFNLVGNALKFTEAGSISIECQQVASPDPDLFARLLFVISDTGIGIPQDKIGSVFEAFEQVDGSYSRYYQGTGLGLGIVKRFVELMDGNITVESLTGKGTTVAVTVKVRHGSTGQDEVVTESKDQTLDLTGIRLLLAEDDRVNQIAASKLLEKRGYAVDCAGDGNEVLEMLSKDDYDCILMDIQMPGMDGIDATKAIRSSKDLGDKGNIPIIALTAHAMAGDREKFIDVGMNDYISKPVEIDQLEEVLCRVMAICVEG